MTKGTTTLCLENASGQLNLTKPLAQGRGAIHALRGCLQPTTQPLDSEDQQQTVSSAQMMKLPTLEVRHQALNAILPRALALKAILPRVLEVSKAILLRTPPLETRMC